MVHVSVLLRLLCLHDGGTNCGENEEEAASHTVEARSIALARWETNEMGHQTKGREERKACTVFLTTTYRQSNISTNINAKNLPSTTSNIGKATQMFVHGSVSAW